MKISDIDYVQDINQEEKLGEVIGGTWGLLGFIPRIIGGIFGYNQQPQTTVINNIYVTNNSSSSSGSGSAAGASAGGSGH